MTLLAMLFVHCFPARGPAGSGRAGGRFQEFPLSPDELDTAGAFWACRARTSPPACWTTANETPLTGLLNRKTFDENLGRSSCLLPVRQTATIRRSNPSAPAPEQDGKHRCGGRCGPLQAGQWFCHLTVMKSCCSLARIMQQTFAIRIGCSFGGEEFVIILVSDIRR